jgi:predicted DNA-binding ribbon-helix-helix protein
MLKNSTIKKEWYQQAAELEKWMVGKTADQIKAMKTKQRDAAHTNVPDVPELASLVSITVQDYIAAVEEASKNAVEVGKGAVTLGLGHVVDLSKSKGYANVDGKETLPNAQVNFTISAAAFDKDGKVLKVVIDTAQTKVAYDKDGKVTSDKTAAVKTKKELGDAYGMAKSSGIKKEWFQQIAELEKWMVGKTSAQISGLKLKEEKADVPELTSLVTVTVTDYLASTVEAASKAK